MGKLPEWGRRGVRRENGVWVRRGGHPRAREKRKRLPCKITPYGRRCYQRQKDNIRSARKGQVLPMGEKPPFLRGWSEWVRVGEFPLRGKRAISPLSSSSPPLFPKGNSRPLVPSVREPRADLLSSRKGLSSLLCPPLPHRQADLCRPTESPNPIKGVAVVKKGVIGDILPYSPLLQSAVPKGNEVALPWVAQAAPASRLRITRGKPSRNRNFFPEGEVEPKVEIHKKFTNRLSP